MIRMNSVNRRRLLWMRRRHRNAVTSRTERPQSYRTHGVVCIDHFDHLPPRRSLAADNRGMLGFSMSDITEIEAAIEDLPARQMDELAGWLEALRVRRATPPPVESWLQRARGAARPGVTTADVMALTRGEE